MYARLYASPLINAAALINAQLSRTAEGFWLGHYLSIHIAHYAIDSVLPREILCACI